MENEMVYEVKHLKKYFDIGTDKKGKRRYVHAVEDASFEISKGEIFGLVGESGSGKSTLGRCMIDLIEPDEGTILFNGKNVMDMKGRQLKKQKEQMQMVFQNPMASFNPKMTLKQSLVEVCHVRGMNHKETEGRLLELMEYVNLPMDTLNRLPTQLSGGQLQRLAIVRSLVNSPQFIVADEPVSALDVSVQGQILNVLLDLNEQMKLTMLFISHELTVVRHMCDRVAVMYLGVIVELAPTKELFDNMQHPYTKSLIMAKPKEHPLEQKEDYVLEGDIPDAVNVPKGCRFANRCPRCKDGLCNELSPELREVAEGHFVACHNPLES